MHFDNYNEQERAFLVHPAHLNEFDIYKAIHFMNKLQHCVKLNVCKTCL